MKAAKFKREIEEAKEAALTLFRRGFLRGAAVGAGVIAVAVLLALWHGAAS